MSDATGESSREKWDENLPLGRWLEAIAAPQPLPAGDASPPLRWRWPPRWSRRSRASCSAPRAVPRCTRSRKT